MWPPPPHVSMSSVWNCLISCPPDSQPGSAVPDSHPELLLLWLLSPARLTSRGVKVRVAVDRKQFAITCRFQQQPWDTSACVENFQDWLTFLWVNPENWLSNANNQTRWIFLRRLKLFHFCGDLRRHGDILWSFFPLELEKTPWQHWSSQTEDKEGKDVFRLLLVHPQPINSVLSSLARYFPLCSSSFMPPHPLFLSQMDSETFWLASS